MGIAIPQVVTEDRASGAQFIDGSLRFDDTKKHYLTQTIGSGTNGFTISFWMKPCQTGNRDEIFDTTASSGFYLYRHTNGSIRINNNSVGLFISNGLYKDSTSFYNIVFSYDSTSSYGSLYVNGRLDKTTSFTTQLYAGTAKISSEASNDPANYYLGQWYLIDGLALGPGYFGYTDPLTGTWRPKKFKAEGTTVNDGTRWRDYLTSSNGGWHADPYGLTAAFNGTVGSGSGGYCQAANGSANPNSVTFDVSSIGGIPFKNSVEVWLINNDNTVTVNGGEAQSIAGTTYVTVARGPGVLNTIVFERPSTNGASLGTIRVDGVNLRDDLTQNLAFGTNGFYLPMDGNTPIGKDQSGNGNDWTPVNFGGSNSIEKATGARPILNTVNGGTKAAGVFGSEVSRNYTILGTSGGGLYRFEGISGTNPPLSFVRGATYIFDYSATNGDHPLAFSTTDPDSSTTSYTDGVNTATSNVTKITVPHDAPDTLYYYCTSHSNMNNAITVTTDETKADPYAWKNVLAMPLDGNGADSSGQINCTTSTKAITTGGSPAADNNSNFYHSAIDFTASSGTGYYPTGAQTDFTFGTGDFTVEFWFKPTSTSRQYMTDFRNNGSGGETGNKPFVIFADNGSDSSGTRIRYANNTSSPNFDLLGGVGLPPSDTWHHLAIVRSSGTVYGYLNGVLHNSATDNTNYNADTSVTVGNSSQVSLNFDGSIQDYRVYKGVAKYTENFIPASTNPDILPDTPSGVSGGSKLTKITEGAVHFGANASDKLRFADSNDMSFGTNDFTFETYYYHESQGSFDIMFDNLGSNRSGSQFSINASGNYAIEIGDGSGNWVWQHTSQPARVKRWTHFAVTRQGSTFRAFVDGVQFATTTSSTAIGNPQRNAIGGYTDNDSSNYGFNGFLSNMRIVNGTALYTSNFTPPTEPLTNVTNTKLLTCQTPTTYQIAAVAPLVSGINDGTVWSSSITSDSLFRSGFPAADAFNGTTKSSTNDCAATPQQQGQGFTFTFGEGVPFTTLQMQCDDNNGGKVFVNGVDITSQLPTGSLTNTTITGVTSPLTSIRLISTNGDALYLGSVTIDGTMLVDPLTPNGDAVTTNFNPFNTDINAIRGQETSYAVMNSLGKGSNVTLSRNNLRAVSGGSGNTNRSGYCNMAVPASGSYYCEATIGATNGMVGIINADYFRLDNIPGCVPNSYAYYENGNKYLGDCNAASYGASFTTGDVIGMGIDRGTLTFYKNGISQGPATENLTGRYFFGFGSYNNTIDFNFGQKPFKFPPPDGFQPISGSTVRPDTVITRPDKFVSAITYTGNGTAQNIGGSSPSQNATVVGGTITNPRFAFNGSGANWATLAATDTSTAAHVDFAVNLTGITRIEAAFDSPSGSGDTRGRYNGANAGNTRTGTGSGYSDIYNGSAITVTSVGFGINQNGTTGTSSDIVSRFRITDSQGTRFIVDRTGEGLRFKPDFVWIKQRSAPDQNHALFDSVRGSGHNLSSSTNHQERSDHSGTTGDLTSFDTNGFSLGSSAASGARPVNLSGKDIVAWCWKAGGSAGTFNVDDVGYANASDVNMSVGSLNNDAYDQSQRWRDNITSSNGWNTSYPVTNIFNGSFDGGGGAANNGNGGVVTFTPPAAITVTKLELSCYSPVTLTLPDGTTREVAGVGSANKDVTVDIGSGFSFTGSNSITISRTGGFIYLERIKINGKELIDNDITPANVPSIAPTGSSVGTKQGFSIIKYAGSGSNSTFPHGLTQAPDFYIVKCLDVSDENWRVYHSSLGATKALSLNSGSEPSTSNLYWNNAEPTSTVASVYAGYDGVNNTGRNYIAYCWHDVPGLQKFGSYVANGNSEGPFVEVGFRPAVVWCKVIQSGQTDNWAIQDTARAQFNTYDSTIRLNDNAAEVVNSGNYFFDFTSNGFKIRNTNGEYNGSNGWQYIYCAWAEAPVSNLYGAQSNAF